VMGHEILLSWKSERHRSSFVIGAQGRMSGHRLMLLVADLAGRSQCLF
jgi:hypothetical protein